jgi:hypothetical protein
MSKIKYPYYSEAFINHFIFTTSNSDPYVYAELKESLVTKLPNEDFVIGQNLGDIWAYALKVDFEKAIALAKRELAHPTTDQILESLAMAKVLGSAELLNVLRLLGNFIREDLTLRREIAVKHNWIKNSAHLSAAAPWLLLLLLSTQPSTSRAFSTQSGALILLAGLAMTAAAYLWMNQLSKLPEVSRVFSGPHIGRRL